ncbi:MAG: hypothetical protein Q7N50_10485 [Armatimonadota bacterium]|nr:hypothetical protein [Armatimonadota bacterium]
MAKRGLAPGSSGSRRVRRKKNVFKSVMQRVAGNQMGSVVVMMMIVLGVLLSYIGVYAKVTKNGYYRANVTSQLREAREENLRLRADIQTLSSPDRLRVIATTAGMQPCNDFDYLSGGETTVVVADASRE